MYELALIVQTVVVASLALVLGYCIRLTRKLERPKVTAREPKVTFTGVPVTVFEDDILIVSTQDGVVKDTEVAVIRVIVRATNKLHKYVHNKKKDQYVRVPEVGAIMVIEGTTIKEVTYPLEMTS